MEKVRQDAVFHRAEEGGMKSHQKERNQKENDIFVKKAEHAQSHDRYFQRLDDANKIGLGEFGFNCYIRPSLSWPGRHDVGPGLFYMIRPSTV